MKRYAIANWKMNLPPEGIEPYIDALRGRQGVVIAPPFPYLKEVAARVPTAAQNCSDQKAGAFTGEVSAAMVRDRGAAYVIVGHSERRKLFGETNDLVARKLSRTIESGLTPILCVGEDQSIRDAGDAGTWVANQIRAAALPELDRAGEVIVAYEPIWAVGTGRNATGAAVAEMVVNIRQALERFWPPAIAKSAPILYGGSVTADNVDDLGTHGRIAGYLVGGASLDSRKFIPICESVDRLTPA